jgi:hypothetical protein
MAITNEEIDELAICAAAGAFDQIDAPQYLEETYGWDAFASYEQNLADTMHEHGVPWDRAVAAMHLMAKEFARLKRERDGESR